MDGNMKNLLDTLNTLREIKWEIIAQAQELDQELETVAEMTTAVITSLTEWQIHTASLPKISGRTAIKIGGHITLRDRDTVRALLVRSFACQ